MLSFIKKYSFNVIITIICIIIIISSNNELYLKIANVLLILGNINVFVISLWGTAEYIRDYRYEKEQKIKKSNKEGENENNIG